MINFIGKNFIDADLEEFGSIRKSLENFEQAFIDGELAEIMGWDTIPYDDNAEPLRVVGIVVGIVENSNEYRLVVEGSVNLAFLKDYVRRNACVIPNSALDALEFWIDKIK